MSGLLKGAYISLVLLVCLGWGMRWFARAVTSDATECPTCHEYYVDNKGTGCPHCEAGHPDYFTWILGLTTFGLMAVPIYRLYRRVN